MEYFNAAFRTTAGFVILWGVTRLLGAKQVSQLTLLDYIAGITIGSITASLAIGQLGPGPTAAGLVLFSLLALGSHRLSLQGRTIQRVLDGAPTLLVWNGRVLEENLRRIRLELQNLYTLLRVKGYFDLSQIQFALLETNGEISVLPKSRYRPVQPRDMGLSPPPERLPAQVVQEGKVLPEALKLAGLTEEWLRSELSRHGIPVEEVFTAQVGTTGTLQVDRYDDNLH